MAKFGRLIRKVIDLVSNISERKSGLHHFVGRLMNQQAELMTWRGELPAHLAPRDTMNNGDARSWVGVPWVQRQRCEIQLRLYTYDQSAKDLSSHSARVQSCHAHNASSVLLGPKILDAILLLCNG
ncbi:hypothetical protein N7454_002571 [Penicillium verhagenii]|nr:hypothetical protein N7454_002571 [Penicillium verhagenii]